MDFRRPQPPFPLADNDGKDERMCEFPWSETEDIPLPEGYVPTKCTYQRMLVFMLGNNCEVADNQLTNMAPLCSYLE